MSVCGSTALILGRAGFRQSSDSRQLLGCLLRSCGMSVRISWPYVSVIIFDVQSLRLLSCLNGRPSEPVVVCGGAEDSANNATHSRIGLDFLCRLQTLALEAGLVAFETRSGRGEGLTISTVVRGVWAFCQIDNHDAVFNGG